MEIRPAGRLREIGEDHAKSEITPIIVLIGDSAPHAGAGTRVSG